MCLKLPMNLNIRVYSLVGVVCLTSVTWGAFDKDYEEENVVEMRKRSQNSKQTNSVVVTQYKTNKVHKP